MLQNEGINNEKQKCGSLIHFNPIMKNNKQMKLKDTCSSNTSENGSSPVPIQAWFFFLNYALSFQQTQRKCS